MIKNLKVFLICVLTLSASACKTTQTVAFRGGGTTIPPVYPPPPAIKEFEVPPSQIYPPRTPMPASEVPPWQPPSNMPTLPTQPTQPTLPNQPPVLQPPGTVPVPTTPIPTTPIPTSPNTDCELSGTLAPGDYDYRRYIKYHRTNFTAFTGTTGNSAFYKEVMENAPIVGGRADRHLQTDLVTNAHETLHFYAHGYGVGVTNNIGHHFIYDRNGQGVRVARFQTTKSQVANIIPDEIRQLSSAWSSTQSKLNISNAAFPVYLINSWHKAAGHLLEEWVCYEGDFRVLLELTKNGYSGKIEQSLNLAQMLYFGTAAMSLVKQNENAYFQRTASPSDPTDYHQLKAAYAMLMEKSVCWLGKAEAHASRIPGLPLQRYIINHLRTSNESAKFRQFLTETYGSVWTRRVLNF